MLIVLNKIIIRKGHFEKVMPLVEENAKFGLEKQPGLIEGYLSRGVDEQNEVMVYSRWQDRNSYEEAKKRLKKDPRSKKIMFQFFPHISKHECREYEIIPLP